jgi:hypothetical protein|tara:strand:- start:453 stop:692 length:240 start_codon:yes stop_codon:yes gene_type:complete
LDNEQRERAAKRILEDPVFQEAWEALRQEFLDSWENSQTQDTEARENLWLGLKILSRLKTHFESILTTGEFKRKNRNPF